MPPSLRTYLPAALDLLMLVVAILLAYTIAFGLAIPAAPFPGSDHALQLRLLLPWWVLTHLGLLALFPLYRGTQAPLAMLALATGCHLVLWAMINAVISGREMFFQLPQHQVDGVTSVLPLPWSALFLYALISLGLMAGWRQLSGTAAGASPARAGRKAAGRAPEIRRLLAGDGPAAERLLAHLRKAGEPLPTEVLTKDVARVGKRFSGIPVVGTVEKLPDVLGASAPAEVLLAMEKEDAAALRELVSACQSCRGRFLRLEEKPGGPVLRPLIPADLFGWNARTADAPALPKLEARSALVGGAGGVLGTELAHQLAASGIEALWLADQHQDALQGTVAAIREAHPTAVVHGTLLHPGDPNALARLMERARPDVVVLADLWDSTALLEEEPGAAILHNTLATAPWIKLAHGFGVGTFVLVSSAEAADPVSVAGATFRLAEQAALARGARSECRFVVVRMPEIAEAPDSLLTRLEAQASGGKAVRLPHPDVELAPLPAREAARLLLGVAALQPATGLLLAVPPTRLTLGDGARLLLAAAGKRPGQDIILEYSGLAPAERLRPPAPEGATPLHGLTGVLALPEERLPSQDTLRETFRTIEWLTAEERPEALLAYLAETVPGYHPSREVTWRPEILRNAPWVEEEEIMPPAPELRIAPEPEPVAEPEPEPEPEPPLKEAIEPELLASPPFREEEPGPETLAPEEEDAPESTSVEGPGTDLPDVKALGKAFEETDLFTAPEDAEEKQDDPEPPATADAEDEQQPPEEVPPPPEAPPEEPWETQEQENEPEGHAPEPATFSSTEIHQEERIQEEIMSPSENKGTLLVLTVSKGADADTLKLLLEQLQQTVTGEQDKLVCLVNPEDTAVLPAGIESLVLGAKHTGALMNDALAKHPGADMLVTLNSEVLFRENALDKFREALAGGTPLTYAHFEEDRDGDRSEVTLHDHEGCPHERFEYGPVIAYRIDAIKGVGGIRNDLSFAWEYDLHLKLMEKKPFKRVREVLYTHFLKVVTDEKGSKVFSPGAGPLGGFSYVFYPEEVEREVTAVFEEALKRRGAWIDHPAAELDHSGKTYETKATVVIPILNRVKFIPNALNKLLVNTYKDFEVVVVDNGSTDGTIELVKEYAAKDPRVRLVHGKGSTIASALNEGIRAARGKYIFQHDSDDEYEPNCIEQFVSHFESHPKCGLAISYYRLMDADGHVITDVDPITHNGYTRNQILRRDGAGACRVFPKAVLEEFGLYDEEHYGNFGEDYDMVVKTGEKYDVDRIHEVLYYYRRHDDNTDVTRDPEMKYKNKNRARQEALRRRMELNRKLGKA